MENINKHKKTAAFRFYAELNDFLKNEWKQKCFEYSFSVPVTVGEIIESIGVPLSEIDLILINGESAGFDFKIKGDEMISVYPVFETFDISPLSRLGREPLRNSRFILDAHLGKLAKYLRMFGFDTLYENDFTDRQIIETAGKEHRIILTRDKDLLCSKDVVHGYFVRSIYVREQLSEVLEKFDLYSQVTPFSRCLICNGLLEKTSKSEIEDRIDSNILGYFNDFFKCDKCDKIYWEGSHYESMRGFIHDYMQNKGDHFIYMRGTNKK
jgi:uncharacterized protein